MPTIMLERSSNVKHHFHSSPFKQGRGLPGILPSPAEFSIVPRTHKNGGKSVTIGIGVICDAYRTVILAADARGSYLHPHLGPNDEMGKQFDLPFGLYANIAGYFSHCQSVIAYLIHEMTSLQEVTHGHIQQAMALAKARELRRRYDNALQNQLGLTIEQWQDAIGKKPRLDRRGRAILHSTPLGVELIVGGFTAESLVLLSMVGKEPPEIVSSHTTIGSGGLPALASLNKRRQNPHYSFQRTVLHIAEALKAAKLKQRKTVGHPSDYVVLQTGAEAFRLKARDPYIRKLIAKYKGRNSAPLDTDDEARNKIKELVYKPENLPA